MKLKREQREKLLCERGIWVTEACGTCGQLLGSVRWTRQGARGEWCSEACRDGIKITTPAPSSKTCRWRITEITQLSAFGISLDNASAIDNN
jgi:hypothetical protein